MEATDTVLGLRIARSDVAFIHDALMAIPFQGDGLMQAAGIISGLARALTTPAQAAPAAPSPKLSPETQIAKKDAALSEEIDRLKADLAAAPPPTLLREVAPVPAPRSLPGGKKRKR